MIREHCGKLLTYRGAARHLNGAPFYHRWKCEVCGRKFTQRVRKAKKKVTIQRPVFEDGIGWRIATIELKL